MNRIIISLFYTIALFSAIFSSACPTDLTVEYQIKPMGVDEPHPRFGWKMKHDTLRRGQTQRSYRIIVTDENGMTTWDTGDINSTKSVGIVYRGARLKSATRYSWRVETVDECGNKASATSFFETGLAVDSQLSYDNWDDARWIGDNNDNLVLHAHYLPVFRLSYSVQLLENTKKASFIYGANDTRLMKPEFNEYGLCAGRDSAYIRLELDSTPIDSGRHARLNIYRVGYHPDDRESVPLKSLTLSAVTQENRMQPHEIKVASNLGITTISVDADTLESFVINPHGGGGDFIAYPVVGDIGYCLPANGKALFYDFTLSHFRSPSNSIVSLPPVTVSGGKDGSMTFRQLPERGMPMLRHTFQIADKPIAKARVYATARGIYDLYINGSRINSSYFSPGSTQYNKTHRYQIYDITELLYKGPNAIGVQLAEGWWSGGATFMGENWNVFGDRQSFLGKIKITYADGTEQTVVSKPETWRVSNDGPLRYSSFFQGEIYDAVREENFDGWSTALYDDHTWHGAVEIDTKHTVAKCGSHEMPRVDDFSLLKLSAHGGTEIIEVDRLQAITAEEVSPGVWIYDMGQNFAGVPEIDFDGLPRGTTVTMRFAEMTYPDLPEHKGRQRHLMVENIRAAMNRDIYIARRGRESFSPRGTYHGYRYIEISGIDHALPLDRVKGRVLSSIHTVSARYETSSPDINRLWHNIIWSSRANFMSIPTDCPQRNERMGWAGDISVFSPTAVYMTGADKFLDNYLTAMRDVQTSDGMFPHIAPVGGGFGGILWGSAGITVPWEVYCHYADTALVTNHYPAMKSYIEYIANNTMDNKTGLIVQNRQWGDLTDWLGPGDSANDKSLLWEAYYIHDLDLMAKMAAVAGMNDDAAKYRDLAEERRRFFNNTYLDRKTGKTIFSKFIPDMEGKIIDTQTSYLLPLAFDIPHPEQKEPVIRNLIASIERSDTARFGSAWRPYSLLTGFIGTAWISDVLTDNGFNDTAYRLLHSVHYPSWLYSVKQGATTIWERLNSYTHTDGFGGNNGMNSFNHYSFGAVGEWMCSRSLGIMRDENAPAFSHFFLKPHIDPTGMMTYAHGHYDSMYGSIYSGWEINDNEVTYRFIVPANTSASLSIPARSIDDVTESGNPLNSPVDGISSVSVTDSILTATLSSGTYVFKVRQ